MRTAVVLAAVVCVLLAVSVNVATGRSSGLTLCGQITLRVPP